MLKKTACKLNHEESYGLKYFYYISEAILNLCVLSVVNLVATLQRPYFFLPAAETKELNNLHNAKWNVS